MVAHFSSFPARGTGREQPSLAFPNTSINTAQQIIVKCLGFSGRIEKDFWLRELAGFGRIKSYLLTEYSLSLLGDLQPRVSHLSPEWTCKVRVGFGNRLPGQMHTTFIAQFCSQLLLCPLPSATLGSSSKTNRRELSGSKYCYFNHLVWGFCWYISTGDEHDFGLIVMATVAAVLVSPCVHRPGQAPAYEPWTGSDTAGSFFLFCLFQFVSMWSVYSNLSWVRLPWLPAGKGVPGQGGVGSTVRAARAGGRMRVSSRSWLVRTGLFILTAGFSQAEGL